MLAIMTAIVKTDSSTCKQCVNTVSAGSTSSCNACPSGTYASTLGLLPFPFLCPHFSFRISLCFYVMPGERSVADS